MLKKARVAFDDEDVERVRRSHLNDLENVLPWVVTTWLYLGTNPSNLYAGIAIRVFVLSRVIHTLSYAIYPKQPFRAVSFFTGLSITAFQAAAVMYHYFWECDKSYVMTVKRLWTIVYNEFLYYIFYKKFVMQILYWRNLIV